GLSEAARASIPIRHVVVLMKENRSFDHLLGRLHDQGQPDAEPMLEDARNPTTSSHTRFVDASHAPTTCWTQDPGHQWVAMHFQVNHGLMDGFVISAKLSTNSDGSFVMSYYDQGDLPFYYWLPSTFALNDPHFASLPSA